MSAPTPQDDLEGRLDAAFKATQPRPGFERELWTKIQASPKRIPIRQRLAALWAPRGGFNFAPALAVLVVVAVVGTGVFLGRGPHGGGANLSTTISGEAPRQGGAAAPADSGAQAAGPQYAHAGIGPWGPLPKPELGNPRNAESAAESGAVPFFGSAELTWSGQLPALPQSLPAYRYVEPQKPDQDSFAAKLQATPSPSGSGYQGPDFSLALFPSTPANGREPIFALTPVNASPPPTSPTDEVARASASDFLTSHNLAPGWDSVISVRGLQLLGVVRYARQFAVPGAAPGVQVDSSGRQVGLDVLVRGDGKVFQVSGPIPVSLATASYRAKAPGAALQAALATSVPGQVKVNLTTATLVYEAVADGPQGYYVPALLFTGLFDQGGQKYEKRVLVQILDPSGLR